MWGRGRRVTFVGLLIAAWAAVSPALAAQPSPFELIQDVVADTLQDLDQHVASCENQIADQDQQSQAAQKRDQCLGNVADDAADGIAEINDIVGDYPGNPGVQAAAAAAIAVIDAALEDAEAAIWDAYYQWLGNSTTTTTSPPTSTSTTSTTTSTTSTTSTTATTSTTTTTTTPKSATTTTDGSGGGSGGSGNGGPGSGGSGSGGSGSGSGPGGTTPTSVPGVTTSPPSTSGGPSVTPALGIVVPAGLREDGGLTEVGMIKLMTDDAEPSLPLSSLLNLLGGDDKPGMLEYAASPLVLLELLFRAVVSSASGLLAPVSLGLTWMLLAARDRRRGRAAAASPSVL